VAVEATDVSFEVYSWHPSAWFGRTTQETFEATYDPDLATRNAALAPEMFYFFAAADPATAMHKLYGWNLAATTPLTASGSVDYVAARAVGAKVLVLDRVSDVPMPADPMWAGMMAPPFEAGLIKHALNDKLLPGTFNNLTPGDLIVGDYSFKVGTGDPNDPFGWNTASPLSSIPVYFRIQVADLAAKHVVTGATVPIEYGELVRVVLTGTLKPGVSADDYWVAYALPHAGIISSSVLIPFEFEATLRLNPADGYYYCDVPLSPYFAWEAKVQYDIYLYGDANGNDLQQSEIIFGYKDALGAFHKSLAVDIIQATNNAVYFAPGWADIAAQASEADLKAVADGTLFAPPIGSHFFIDYTDNAYDMYQWYKDNVF
jgi:hypothetical protein